MTKYLVLAAILFSATACGETHGASARRHRWVRSVQAAAPWSALLTGHPLLGALVGGIGGAGIGAATTPRSPLLKLYSDRLREAAYQVTTVTRRNVAGMELTGVPGLLFWLVNRASSSFRRSPARPNSSPAAS